MYRSETRAGSYLTSGPFLAAGSGDTWRCESDALSARAESKMGCEHGP